MDLSSLKIVFIGAGNMAEALVSGLLTQKLCASGNITVTDVLQERLDYFAEKFAVAVSSDNTAAANEADLVVLAVKPQMFDVVLAGMRDAVNVGRTLFVSIAAGITTSAIEAQLGNNVRVVRVMPNTPALAGKGASALCAGSQASQADMDLVQSMLEAVGLAVQVDEKDMDAITAVSGSGPAYVFFLIEAMQQSAEKLGLSRDMARDLVLATVEGAAALCLETGVDAAELRRRVTSKGGTTAAAMDVLDKQSVFDSLIEAITAARDRSVELAENS